MSGTIRALSIVALCLWASIVSAGAGMLDVIPEDAAAAFAIRDLNGLKKKGDKFIADAELKLPIRPSQLFDLAYTWLGITGGVDENGTAAILIANPKTVGVGTDLQALEQLVVLAVPFTDRDHMASNFGIEAGVLKPDTVVPGKSTNFGKFFYARGKHLFLSNNEKALLSIARGKSVGSTLTAAQRRTFGEADMLVHLGVKTWPSEWKDSLESLKKQLEQKDEASDAVVRQFIESAASIRVVLAGMRIDDGLGLNVFTVFPKEGNESVRKFLTTLQGGPGVSDLTGLPDGPVVAAQAARGDGAQNAFIVRAFVDHLLHDLFQTKWFPSAADRPNFLNVFTEVWKQLKGSRAAVYQNADEQKHGLFSMVAILDTDDTDKFLGEMKQLTRFAGDLSLAGKDAGKENAAAVEQLIRDLGDNKFSVRQSASTKLGLIGEPALPYLEKALSNRDLEVRRRAEDLKTRIVYAAAERRKELLSKDLTRRVKPSFAFAKPQTREGQRIETVRVKLADQDVAAVPQLRQLFGPDWDSIRLAVHGKQVVALLGSDERLLQAALKNLKDGKPGLAASKTLAPFMAHGDPARKAEFHLALQTAMALMKAEDLKHPLAAGQHPVLTSFAVTVDPERIQFDLWVPSKEVKVIATAAGW